MDGYALRRVKALLNKVGIVRLHEVLGQASPARERNETYLL